MVAPKARNESSWVTIAPPRAVPVVSASAPSTIDSFIVFAFLSCSLLSVYIRVRMVGSPMVQGGLVVCQEKPSLLV